MLDAKVTPYIKPMLRPLVSWLDKQNVTPNQITVAGFCLGLLAMPFIILGVWSGAFACSEGAHKMPPRCTPACVPPSVCVP